MIFQSVGDTFSLVSEAKRFLLFLTLIPAGLGLSGIVVGSLDSNALLLAMSSALLAEAISVGLMLCVAAYRQHQGYIARGLMEDRRDKYGAQQCARIAELERQLREK